MSKNRRNRNNGAHQRRKARNQAERAAKRLNLRLAKDPAKDRSYFINGSIVGGGVSCFVWSIAKICEGDFDKGNCLIAAIIAAAALIGMMMTYGTVCIISMRNRERTEAVEDLPAQEAAAAAEEERALALFQETLKKLQSEKSLNRALIDFLHVLQKWLEKLQ